MSIWRSSLDAVAFNNIYSGKKVLVTGHTGFKGSWLCLWLKQLGAEVCGVSDRIPTTPSLFETAKVADYIDHDLREDIRNRESLQKIMNDFRPDFVFHLAANAIVRSCYDNPIEAFEVNAMGSLNVLTCINHLEKPPVTVMITSDKCYENVEWEYGYRETDQLGGKDPYSASKACAEIIFHSFYESYLKPKEVKIATTRAGNVIGGGDWAEARIVPDSIRAWSQGDELEIRSPRATRPWQLVLEPLSGYLRLGQRLLEGEENLEGESFNFGPQASVVQPVEILIQEMQKTWKEGSYHINEQGVGQKKEAGLLKLCCDRSLMRLDWEAILNFEETIKATAGWYREYYLTQEKPRELSLAQINWYQNQARERGAAWIK